MHLLHVMLRPELLPADVHRGATEAMRLGLAGVVVAPVWVHRVATMLRGSGVPVWAAVSFPSGTSKPTVKAIEATSCIKDGADAIWVVPHFASVIRADFDALKLELLEINRAARATRRDVAIHLLLLIEEVSSIAAACRAARESGCDGIVVSANVDLLMQLIGGAEGLSITVTGATDATKARALLAAGADRIASERAIELAVESVER